MEKRRDLILSTIIKEFIKTGLPVSSGLLVEKYKLGVSPATVRNEMADLEENGYIIQPHTSAGRVPTEKAYQYFVANLKDKKLSDRDLVTLKKAIEIKDELAFKKAAKELAHISGQAVFWAFHKHDLYHTGISNLLSQSEFKGEPNLVHDISLIIDRMEDILEKHFERFDHGTSVLIGSSNPFSAVCSCILVKYKKDNHDGLVGILGPLRMDYEKNIGLIKFIEEKLK